MVARGSVFGRREGVSFQPSLTVRAAVPREGLEDPVGESLMSGRVAKRKSRNEEQGSGGTAADHHPVVEQADDRLALS